MLDKKIVRLLGLGRAAGSVACGAGAVETGIKRKTCVLVIIASDCGKSTYDKFANLCKINNIKCIFCDSKGELGSAVGYAEKAVIGITNRQLADGILSQL